MAVDPIKFRKNCLYLLDQRKLPEKETWIACRDAARVHWAIREMVVRGAPAIGITGGYGLYLAMLRYRGTEQGWLKYLKNRADYLKASRPTGVNLRNVIDFIVSRVAKRHAAGGRQALAEILKLAKGVHEEDVRLCRAIGRHGARLFKSGDQVLTHCNAGGLATSGYGTALGVIYASHESGKKLMVYADETRPLLQGARLTAWELKKSGVPCALVCDNAAASLMSAGKVDRIVVGADRIAANGDTANKIGTYNLAVLARVHGIPFYIAAPGTTFDFTIKDGRGIPIEERHAREVTEGMGRRTAPKGIAVVNPAFDVTPARYISAFITEAGVLRPPFRRSFQKLKKRQAIHD